MFSFVDHLHSLPRSLTIARWSTRLAGCAVAVGIARLITLSLDEARLPIDGSPAPKELSLVVREPISNWHLFGNASSGDKVGATTLALTLHGIVNHADANRRIAVIAGQDQRDVAYHIGDTLPGGGVLDAVHPAYVVLLNGGLRESLALVGWEALPQSGSAAGGATGLSLSGPSTPLINANLLPITEGPVVIGIKISTPNIASLERIGLRRDDIITSIDGTELSGPNAGEVLQDRLRKGGSATVVIRRDGREQTHSINFGP